MSMRAILSPLLFALALLPSGGPGREAIAVRALLADMAGQASPARAEGAVQLARHRPSAPRPGAGHHLSAAAGEEQEEDQSGLAQRPAEPPVEGGLRDATPHQNAPLDAGTRRPRALHLRC